MVYARRQTRPKPRSSQAEKWSAPVSGWVSNRALADPAAIEGPGAAVMDNFFPRATGVALRRGKELYATLEDLELPVRSLFAYQSGSIEKLFGANDNVIYDLTNVVFPEAAELGDGVDQFITDTGDVLGWASTANLDVSSGYTNGDWSVIQFATTGGIYLVGVNGVDTGFIYDGTEFWPNTTGGLWYVPLQSETTPFVEGETVTGGTSGAVATIYRDDTTQLIVSGIVELEEEWTLAYDAGTADFVAGDTITGDTSDAVAVVKSVSGTTTDGTLTITGLISSFIDDEPISATGGGAAVANGTQVYSIGGPFQSGETLTGSIGGSAVSDGTQSNAAPGMDFGTLNSSNMSFVWSYKNRLWFIERDSLNVWYLNVDSIGGEAKVFPMGGIFSNGGELLFGARWSLESGDSGGLSEQNVFVTTNGEAAIYQGDSPDSAATWSLRGVYRIGSPLGKKAYLRGGGDLAIATTVGLVPLSKAISLDVTALNVATVSYKIADAWTEALQLRGDQNWQAMIWPEQKFATISPPDTVGSSDPVMFISNTETGAWSRYTNWHGLCLETFRGQLYFGSPEGKVFQANVGGTDDGETYTGVVIPLHNDMGSLSASKIGKMARAITRSNADVNDRIDILVDYNITPPAAPDATPLTGTNFWGDAIWGQAQWSSPIAARISAKWRSAGGYGFVIAPCYQVTSGSIAPLDVELISMETLHTVTEVVG